MPWKSVNPDNVHRLFYPQVPVIIAVNFHDRVGGMPAIWCMPLSFKPPLVGVAIAPEHETFKMIVQAEAFAVNFVSVHYAEQVGVLGESSSREIRNKLASAGFTVTEGKLTGQPLIQEAEAALECRLYARHRVGTHELVVGEVAAAMAGDNFGEYWNFDLYTPILYAGTEVRGGKCWVFRSLKGEKVTVPLKHQP